MSTDELPFRETYDLRKLGRNGVELEIAPKGEALEAIARWADVRRVEAFAAKLRLRKNSSTQFVLDGELTADVVQDCVVTLEPVRSHIERPVHRELHLTNAVRLRPHETIPLGAGAGDDEVPDEIDSSEYDLAGPLLEELALAIEPYPRAPGVEFAAVGGIGGEARKPLRGAEKPQEPLLNPRKPGKIQLEVQGRFLLLPPPVLPAPPKARMTLRNALRFGVRQLKE